MANAWEFEMDSLRKASEFSSKGGERGRHSPRTFPLRSRTVFWMTRKRKCSGMHSSTAWMPTRRGQLSQRLVPFFAPSFCRAFRKNQNGNHACCGVQRIIGIEKDGASPVLFSAYNVRRELLCHYSSAVGRTVIFRLSVPLHAKKLWNCSMK